MQKPISFRNLAEGSTFESVYSEVVKSKRGGYEKAAFEFLVQVFPENTSKNFLRDIATDLVQDFFLKVWEKKEFLSQGGSVKEGSGATTISAQFHKALREFVEKYFGTDSVKIPIKVKGADFVPSNTEKLASMPEQEKLLAFSKLKEALERVIDTFTPREKKVIKMRYGLSPFEKEHTLDEIAQAEAVTRERIRVIEAKVFKKFREPNTRDSLKDYSEE